MKADELKQKNKQFTDGLDADIVVLVHPKDSDHIYRWFNGDRKNLADMMFRVMVDMVENGDKNEEFPLTYDYSGR